MQTASIRPLSGMARLLQITRLYTEDTSELPERQKRIYDCMRPHVTYNIKALKQLHPDISEASLRASLSKLTQRRLIITSHTARGTVCYTRRQENP